MLHPSRRVAELIRRIRSSHSVDDLIDQPWCVDSSSSLRTPTLPWERLTYLFQEEAKVGRDDQGQSFGGCVRDNPCPSEIQTRYRRSDLSIGFRVAITD